MIGALQRVPGVLFAEANAAQTCVVVAHDAAVPTMPLVAAAEATGVSVDILADPRPALLRGKSEPHPRVFQNRRP